MIKSFTYENVKHECNRYGLNLLSIEYKNNLTPLLLRCSKGHYIETTFKSIRNGRYCKHCSNNKKRLTQQVITDYLSKYGFILLSNYKNNKTNIKIQCSKGHITEKSFTDFKKYHSCKECILQNKFGDKNINWNPNRYEVSLNKKLRISRSFKWVKDNLQNDVNYNNFLNNRDLYHIDHIIPISLFSKLSLHYNLNENELKKIINSKDNLQILLKSDNQIKYSNGSIFEACQFLSVKGIKL